VSKLKTERKRYSRALNAIYEWCQKQRHRPVKEQQQRLAEKIAGHIGYYGVSYNFDQLESFIREAERIWKKWLNRRGAPRNVTWEKFRELRDRHPWPKPKNIHSLFDQRAPLRQRELRLT
jgi:RNA-directed DNA polymerase